MSNQITPNPSVPSQVVAEVKFPRWINNLGIIPTSYKDSMSYYECLAWLCKFLEETVIPSVNENGEAVEELQNLYVELNGFVTNYFDNLDVQEEINNKLDQMVEEGSLQTLIDNYFAHVDERIDELTEETESELNNMKELQDNNQLRIPTLEYMHTIHTELTSVQGMCADDEHYYYYDNVAKKLIKRSLASNELINEYNVDLLHGNGLTKLNNIIYATTFEDNYCRTYDLTTNTQSAIGPFSVDGMSITVGITKYDDNNLIISLGASGLNTSAKITDLKFIKYNVTNATYSEIQLLNPNKINLSGQTVLQDMEYLNGKLYFLNSQNTQIVTCDETEEGNFIINNLFTYPTYDNIGVAYGEAEGISIIPDTYNGKFTLLIMCQVNRWNPSQHKTLKFYCFNLYNQLPLTKYSSFYENGTNKQNIQVDVNATTYFENGKGAYPFKDLCSALECLNNYKGNGQTISIHAGTYYMQDCRNFKGMLIPIENGVTIQGNFQIINSQIHLGNASYKTTINSYQLLVSAAEFTAINCDITSSATSTRVFQQDSKVHLIDCDLTTNAFTEAHNSFVWLKLTSAQRLPSGQILAAKDGSIVYLANSTIANGDVSNDGSSLIVSPGRVNNS